MRVIVTGCRRWSPEALAGRVVSGLVARHGAANLVVVHGACPTGIDALFARVAAGHPISVQAFPARWDDISKPGAVVRRRRDGTLYDAAAGPNRNQEMADAGADLCLAFHRDLASSKGTGDMVRRALKAGIPTWLVASEDAPPVRLGETQ